MVVSKHLIAAETVLALLRMQVGGDLWEGWGQAVGELIFLR